MDWPKALIWWAAIEVLGFLALPLTFRLFSRLPTRGYILSKPLGLLLVSYLLWLGASLRLIPNTRAGAALALLLMAIVSAGLGLPALRRAMRVDLQAWLRREWKPVLAGELLLLLAFLAWAWVRSFYPEIFTGEKRMEYAFINGILNSRWFPPQDPWLAGYSISYYYFGHLMIAVLVRLTGIDLSVAFTLAAALWFGLTLAVSFGVVYDLVRLSSEGEALPAVKPPAEGQGRALWFGLLGAVLVGLAGNLAGVIELLYQLKLAPAAWFQGLDLRAMVQTPPGGSWPPDGFWWLHATRIISDRDPLGYAHDVFTEFPFISFLDGDLHAQAFNLPFIPLAIGLAANIFIGASRDPGAGFAQHPLRVSRPARSGRLQPLLRSTLDYAGLGRASPLVLGIVLGGLAFIHSWDAIAVLLLVAGAVVLGVAHRKGRFDLEGVLQGGLIGAVVAALAYICYGPFYANLHAPVGGLMPNLFFPTRLSQYLIMFGAFLPPLIGFLVLAGRGTDRLLRRTALILPAVLLVPAALAVLLALVRLGAGAPLLAGIEIRSEAAALVSGWQPSVLLATAAAIRAANPWAWLALGMIVAWLLAVMTGAVCRSGDQRAGMDRLVLAMMLLGFGMALALEFLYVDEPLGTRTNSVYKFYYQGWLFFSIAAAYGLSRVLGPSRLATHATITGLASALLLSGALFFTVAALPGRTNHFSGPQTLDSLAYLRRDMPDDLAGVAWLREHAAPGALVVEAPAADYRVGHDSLVSTLTGNPTLIGWWDHEIHWRGPAYQALIGERSVVAREIYLATDPAALVGLLRQWRVDYLFVGNNERSRYKLDDPNITLYDQALRLAFTQGGVRIYAVP